MIVEWSDDLKIGVGLIDDQHKKLVERIAAFAEAIEADDEEAIIETIKYLIGYAIQHFSAEELLMIRNGYRDFKVHRDEHTYFIKMVYDVNMSLLNKSLSNEEIKELRDELISWVITHIKVTDQKLADTIK